MAAELSLRPYQADLVQAVADAPERSVLVQLPTGGGKTEIAVALAQREAARGGHTLFVVERVGLAAQAQVRFTKYGMLSGVLRGEDSFVRGYEPVTVASIQTLAARWDRADVRAVVERASLVIIDEAHRRFRHHVELREHLPRAKFVGLSATPLRDGLAHDYERLIRGPSYDELIQAGHLVRCRYFVPGQDAMQRALADVSVSSTGDFVSGQLGELMREKRLVGDVVSTWRAKAADRPTIVFAVNIAHSKALADEFASEGIAVEHIDAYTDHDERRQMFERFRTGRTRVLTSVDVLGTGFDEPTASCAILGRPTLSLSLHIQQIGRVMRPAPGKADAIVLDHACNLARHGRVEAFECPELSDLDSRSDRKRKADVEPDYRPCPECSAIMDPGQRVCDECGHEIARRHYVESVPGELVEEREPEPALDYQRLYRELRQIGIDRGYKPAWAWAQMKSNLQFNAPRDWLRLEPVEASPKTLRLVKSWQIRYAKRRAAA